MNLTFLFRKLAEHRAHKCTCIELFLHHHQPRNTSPREQNIFPNVIISDSRHRSHICIYPANINMLELASCNPAEHDSPHTDQSFVSHCLVSPYLSSQRPRPSLPFTLPQHHHPTLQRPKSELENTPQAYSSQLPADLTPSPRRYRIAWRLLVCP